MSGFSRGTMMIKKWLDKIWLGYGLLPAIVLSVMIFYPFAVNLTVSNTELLDNRPLKTQPNYPGILPEILKLIIMILLPDGRSF